MKKKILLAVLTMFLVSGFAFAEDSSWTKGQKILLGTYLVAETIDYFQTREILANDKFCEINPFITDEESLNVCFLASTGIIILSAHFLPKYRTKILAVTNIIKWVMVGRNNYIGVRINF